MARRKAQSKYNAPLYQLVAHAYIWRTILIPITAVSLLVGLLINHKTFMMVGLGSLGLLLLVLFLYAANARRAVCRLCRTPLMMRLKTSSRRKPQTISILGDRNLSAAVGLACRKKTIRCQHCGEKQIYFD